MRFLPPSAPLILMVGLYFRGPFEDTAAKDDVLKCYKSGQRPPKHFIPLGRIMSKWRPNKLSRKKCVCLSASLNTNPVLYWGRRLEEDEDPHWRHAT